ncbi:hypothetical protein BDC45DRAFT_608794, partial [Circinella umbellata]
YGVSPNTLCTSTTCRFGSSLIFSTLYYSICLLYNKNFFHIIPSLVFLCEFAISTHFLPNQDIQEITRFLPLKFFTVGDSLNRYPFFALFSVGYVLCFHRN